MIYNMTAEVLRLHIIAFFKANMQPDEFDETDLAMLEQCIMDAEFRKNMAGDGNPYYRDLVEEFKQWLIERRKSKIQNVLDS